MASVFPELRASKDCYGAGVLLAVAERWGADSELHYLRQGAFFAQAKPRARTALPDRLDPNSVARVLSGIAHPDRIRLALAILAGAGTHQLLNQAVPMKAGPLYHHLRELERGGLLSMVARNTYQLTEIGRMALFVVTAIGGPRASWKVKRFCKRSR